MGIMIRDLSSHPFFQNDFLMIAGFGGIDNMISYISVIDTPMIPVPSYHLNDGVFVLSSFFLYKDDPDHLLEAIKNLARIGVSAIGIKTDLYIRSIPETVLDFCNQANIPLFQTNDSRISFRKIISVVEGLLRTQDRPSLLSDTGAGDIRSLILRQAKENISVNFICLTPELDVILKYTPHPAPSGTKLIDAVRNWFTQENIQPVLSLTETYITREHLYLFPCRVYNALEAVMAFEYPGSLGPYQISKIQDLASLLSLLIMENILMEKGRMSALMDQVNGFLLSEYPDEDAARMKFEILGFPSKDHYRVVLMESPELSASDTPYYASVKTEKLLNQRMSQLFKNVISFNARPYLIFVVPIPKDSKYAADNAFSRAMEIFSEFRQLKVKYTKTQPRLMDISLVYRHLLQAAKIDFAAPGAASAISLVNDFDTASLTLALISSNQHRLLRESVITPIQRYDQQYHSNIWNTLAECMAVDRLDLASTNLHIHPSTLRYRLQKIEALTGYNFFHLQDKVVLYSAYLLQAAE